MNVAALLQDSPSDDHRRRQQQQHQHTIPPPPPQQDPPPPAPLPWSPYDYDRGQKPPWKPSYPARTSTDTSPYNPPQNPPAWAAGPPPFSSHDNRPNPPGTTPSNPSRVRVPSAASSSGPAGASSMYMPPPADYPLHMPSKPVASGPTPLYPATASIAPPPPPPRLPPRPSSPPLSYTDPSPMYHGPPSLSATPATTPTLTASSVQRRNPLPNANPSPSLTPKLNQGLSQASLPSPAMASLRPLESAKPPAAGARGPAIGSLGDRPAGVDRDLASRERERERDRERDKERERDRSRDRTMDWPIRDRDLDARRKSGGSDRIITLNEEPPLLPPPPQPSQAHTQSQAQGQSQPQARPAHSHPHTHTHPSHPPAHPPSHRDSLPAPDASRHAPSGPAKKSLDEVMGLGIGMGMGMSMGGMGERMESRRNPREPEGGLGQGSRDRRHLREDEGPANWRRDERQVYRELRPGEMILTRDFGRDREPSREQGTREYALSREHLTREQEREREMIEREANRNDARERDLREREREARDRKDMDIIRAAASTRQTQLSGRGSVGPGSSGVTMSMGVPGRGGTPTELLVLKHTNVGSTERERERERGFGDRDRGMIPPHPSGSSHSHLHSHHSHHQQQQPHQLHNIGIGHGHHPHQHGPSSSGPALHAREREREQHNANASSSRLGQGHGHGHSQPHLHSHIHGSSHSHSQHHRQQQQQQQGQQHISLSGTNPNSTPALPGDGGSRDAGPNANANGTPGRNSTPIQQQQQNSSQSQSQSQAPSQSQSSQGQSQGQPLPPTQSQSQSQSHTPRPSQPTPPPQSQFQSQFHSQFVPGLPMTASGSGVIGGPPGIGIIGPGSSGSGSSSGSGGVPGLGMGMGGLGFGFAAGSRSGSRMGSRMGSPVGVAGEGSANVNGKKTGGGGLGRGKGSKLGGGERERGENEREREGERVGLGAGVGVVVSGGLEGVGVPVGMGVVGRGGIEWGEDGGVGGSFDYGLTVEDDDEWEEVREGEEGGEGRGKVCVRLGTFVFPRVPFPYFFDAGIGVGVNASAAKKDDADPMDVVEDGGAVVAEKEKDKEKVEETEVEKEKKPEDVDMADKEKAENADTKKDEETEKEVDQPEEAKKTPTPTPVEEDRKEKGKVAVVVEEFLLDRETRATIIIPNGYIPLEKPLRPKIWGGGVVSARRRGAAAMGRRNGQVPMEVPRDRRLEFGDAQDQKAVGDGVKMVRRRKRKRRVYTDDSDLFLCAVHAGWVTWSGARRARRLGRDMKIEVRVLRCVGSGGTGVPGDEGKEEVVARFVGGWGERCYSDFGKVALKKTGKGLDLDEDVDIEMDGGETSEDDEDDDGRGLVSAGWGSGHDGSGIEILGVEFVDKGTARAAPGLGLRNRSQRLFEYNERRANVLGLGALIPGRNVSARLAGRKRRRGWDWPIQQPRRLPNAVVLDVIPELDEEPPIDVVNVEFDGGVESDSDEEIQMSMRTVVFGLGPGGEVHAGFKYNPDVLKDAMFPSSQPSERGSRPPRKRRRVNESFDDMGMDVDVDDHVRAVSPLAHDRSVILESPKECYLLSPSVDEVDGLEMKTGRRYDISLILEGELVEDHPKLVDETVVPTPTVIDSGGTKSATNIDAEVVPHTESISLLPPQPTNIPPEVRPPSASPHEPAVQETSENLPSSTGGDALLLTKPEISANIQANEADAIPRETSPIMIPDVMDGSPLSSPLPHSSPPLPTSPRPTISNDPTTMDNAISPAPETELTEVDHVSIVDVVDNDTALAVPSTPRPTDLTLPIEASIMTSPTHERPKQLLQVLQRHLGEDDIKFTYDGVNITDRLDNSTKTEWKIFVKRWKWAPRNL